MAWNEPGGSQDNDPWGGRRKKQGPPDLDEVIKKIQQKLAGLFGGKGGSGGGGDAPKGSAKGILALIALALVVWLAVDSIYIIQPAERGVVLRFGKYVATLQPGPSIRLPRPIEQVLRVDVDQIRTVEVGYRSGGKATILSEASMLTQDENIVDVKLAVQYKVKSPSDYLFNDRDPEITIRDATESAIREVVGKSKMDFVLKEGRSEVAARTKKLLQTILDRYNNGLLVTSVNLQDAQPPEQVQEAFFDAIRAREDQDRLIKEAEAYSNEVIPKARGGAARITEDANAYKAKIVATADGDVSRFSQILSAYQKAPKVTRERMYLETLESVMSKTSKVLVDVSKGSNLLYLPLDKLTQHSAAKGPSASTNTDSQNSSTSSSKALTAQEDVRQRASNSSSRTLRPTRETR